MQMQVQWNLKMQNKRENKRKEEENDKDSDRGDVEKSDLEMEIETPICRNKKPYRIVRRGAEEQWAEAQPLLAAADRRPCRDFFH